MLLLCTLSCCDLPSLRLFPLLRLTLCVLCPAKKIASVNALDAVWLSMTPGRFPRILWFCGENVVSLQVNSSKQDVQRMKKYLDPKADLAFKEIFGELEELLDNPETSKALETVEEVRE